MLEVVIFDPGVALLQLDLVDAQAYVQAAQELRPELAADAIIALLPQYAERSRRQRSRRLVEHFDLEAAARARMHTLAMTTPWQALLQLREQAFAELIISPTMIRAATLPYHAALLYIARATGCRIALTTGLPCAQMCTVLQVIDLADTFDLVVAREDIEAGWPAAESFHLVAQELQVPEHDCLAVVGSPDGAVAALAAGMPVLAVAPTGRRETFSNLAPPPSYAIVEPGATLPEALYAWITHHQRRALPEEP